MTTRLLVDGEEDGEVTNLRVFPDAEGLWASLILIKNRYKIRNKITLKYTQSCRKERMAYLKKRGAR